MIIVGSSNLGCGLVKRSLSWNGNYDNGKEQQLCAMELVQNTLESNYEAIQHESLQKYLHSQELCKSLCTLE